MRWLLLAVVGVAIVAYFGLGLGRYLGLEYLQERHAALEAYYAERPWLTAGAFFAVYVALAGLSLPGAVLMTLVGGALFGLLWGTVIVSLASTAGATLAFLIARFALREWVQARFGAHLRAVNAGVAREGPFYLFALRLVPLFPFFVVNLVMGLTPMRAPTFAYVSQAGMLPGTLVFVNAGTRLAEVDSLRGILSPGLVLSFCLLAMFPLLARRAVTILGRRRALRGYPRPARFDRDVVVIGAGSAGLVSALVGAAARAKVTLVERDRMGGDCLNTGCVPSKALIRAARLLAEIARARELGIRRASAEFDFAEIMARVREAIRAIEPRDSVERYQELGVECLAGEAQVTSPYQVEVAGRTLTTRAIVVAAGARPLVPPIPGIDTARYVTSDTVWGLTELPRRLVVLGGGPIGCELSQSFARLGSQVTLVEMLPRLLPTEDPEISERVRNAFAAEGIEVLAGHRAMEFAPGGRLVCARAGEGSAPAVEVEFDLALVALGRRASGEGMGLEALGVQIAANGTIVTDQHLQTRVPTIYACGDVAGPLQFTHVASHQAWYATINALFGGLRRFRVDYSVIPYAIFTDPEVARVGLSEAEARAREVPYEVTRLGFDEVDRAVADARADGELKVLTVPGRDRILGAAIIGHGAGDLIAEYALAMRHRLGLKRILGTVHAYPTMMEVNRLAAGRWRREHLPSRALDLLGRYHAWRRGT